RGQATRPTVFRTVSRSTSPQNSNFPNHISLPICAEAEKVSAQLFTILPKNNALPAPSFSRPGIGKMQKFLDYGV
ncbi:MAG: hypothetical protein SO355_07925, partial [Candidatus Faecousia sp.]|nr:hypothetical protein [Candidatus Faecousia sp.]